MHVPNSQLCARLTLLQEVKLADSSAERDLYESLAEIYSIILTLDALEKAYLRDSIVESEYTEICDRLLRQYKNNLADESVSAAFGDLERFKAEWDVRSFLHLRALERTLVDSCYSSRCLKLPSVFASAYRRRSNLHLQSHTASSPNVAPPTHPLGRPVEQQPHTSSPPRRTSSPSSMPSA